LCFPTLFNELHKVARHASRRSFRFLSKPVAPIYEQLDYRVSDPEREKGVNLESLRGRPSRSCAGATKETRGAPAEGRRPTNLLANNVTI